MKASQKLTFSISHLHIIIFLLVVILGMFALWRPWEGSKAERTITSTGHAEVEGTPDEFTFSPYFQRSGADTAKLKTELDAYGNKLLADLTKLGINKDDITLNSSNFDQSSVSPAYPGGQEVEKVESNVMLSVQIKAPNEELAQKVQDYLAKTDAKGQLTSAPNFSKQKRERLEGEARDKATKDARQKAETTAKNLGGSLGKVIKVKDTSSQPPVSPLYGVAEDSSIARSMLPVTPGKDKISLSVEVIFELR